MTPLELNTAARRRYNAVSDNFWSDEEMYQSIYDACLELAREALAIERTYETTTVSGTQAYDFPTNAMSIKRVTWNGRKLTPIDMREDDAITGLNMTTTDTGTPEFYFQWNKAIYLRPVPNATQTLKIWTHNFPSTVSANSTIEVPEEFQMKLVNYCLMKMSEKDRSFESANYYMNLWERDKADIRRWIKKMKRADGFATVKDENMVVETYIGGS